MGCHHFKFGDGTSGIVTLPNIYEYKGFIFEFHSFCGPTKLKKNFKEAKRTGRKFYKVITEWCQLNKREKRKTQVYG